MDKLTNEINGSVERANARQAVISTKLAGIPEEFLVHLPATDDQAELDKGAQKVLERFARCAPAAAAERERVARMQTFAATGLSPGIAALVAETKLPAGASNSGSPAPARFDGLTAGQAAIAAATRMPGA